MTENLLGSYLKAQRLAKKLSLRAAAAAIGIDHMRLSDIERGINRATEQPTRPSRALIEKIARAYQLPTDYLLDLAGYPRTRPEMDDETGLLVELFRDLDNYHRSMALGVVRMIHAAAKSESPRFLAAEPSEPWPHQDPPTDT